MELILQSEENALLRALNFAVIDPLDDDDEDDLIDEDLGIDEDDLDESELLPSLDADIEDTDFDVDDDDDEPLDDDF